MSYWWRIGIPEIIRDILAETIEIETHLHSKEHWLGLGASHTTFTPYTVICSNVIGEYGAWVELLGAGDTPFEAGNVFYDPHRITIENIETNQKLVRLQFFYGATGDAPGDQDVSNVTETIIRVDTGDKGANPTEMRNLRVPSGTPLQCRMAMDGSQSKFVKFFLGTHEYGK